MDGAEPALVPELSFSAAAGGSLLVRSISPPPELAAVLGAEK
jgi:hypothetical protein